MSNPKSSFKLHKDKPTTASRGARSMRVIRGANYFTQELRMILNSGFLLLREGGNEDWELTQALALIPCYRF